MKVRIRKTRLLVPWWKFALHIPLCPRPLFGCGICREWEEDA